MSALLVSQLCFPVQILLLRELQCVILFDDDDDDGFKRVYHKMNGKGANFIYDNYIIFIPLNGSSIC